MLSLSLSTFGYKELDTQTNFALKVRLPYVSANDFALSMTISWQPPATQVVLKLSAGRDVAGSNCLSKFHVHNRERYDLLTFGFPLFHFSLDSRGSSTRLNVGSHDIPLFFPPVAEVPNIPLRVSGKVNACFLSMKRRLLDCHLLPLSYNIKNTSLITPLKINASRVCFQICRIVSKLSGVSDFP